MYKICLGEWTDFCIPIYNQAFRIALDLSEKKLRDEFSVKFLLKYMKNCHHSFRIPIFRIKYFGGYSYRQISARACMKGRINSKFIKEFP